MLLVLSTLAFLLVWCFVTAYNAGFREGYYCALDDSCNETIAPRALMLTPSTFEPKTGFPLVVGRLKRAALDDDNENKLEDSNPEPEPKHKESCPCWYQHAFTPMLIITLLSLAGVIVCISNSGA